MHRKPGLAMNINIDYGWVCEDGVTTAMLTGRRAVVPA